MTPVTKSRVFIALMTVTALVLAGCGGSAQHRYHTHYGVQAHSPTFGLPPKNLSLRPTVVPPSLVSTVQMLDTVNVNAFSGLHPGVVAGYTSGFWPTYFQMVGHYPHVVAVMVNVNHFGVSGHRSCLDVEPGDASPSQAGPWDRKEINRGFIPCDYGSLSEMPAIKASIRSSGISLSRVYLFDANWTYRSHLDFGYACTQWTDHYLNRNIDGSQCTQAFAGIAPTPLLPICYHHRISRTQCAAVKTRVAKVRRAAASSHRAYVVRGCPTLAQRDAWFSKEIRLHPNSPRLAYRKRALATTRRAEKRQACSVFRGRANFFTHQAQHLISVN